jgi:hypothetical protein
MLFWLSPGDVSRLGISQSGLNMSSIAPAIQQQAQAVQSLGQLKLGAFGVTDPALVNIRLTEALNTFDRASVVTAINKAGVDAVNTVSALTKIQTGLNIISSGETNASSLNYAINSIHEGAGMLGVSGIVDNSVITGLLTHGGSTSIARDIEVKVINKFNNSPLLQGSVTLGEAMTVAGNAASVLPIARTILLNSAAEDTFRTHSANLGGARPDNIKEAAAVNILASVVHADGQVNQLNYLISKILPDSLQTMSDEYKRLIINEGIPYDRDSWFGFLESEGYSSAKISDVKTLTVNENFTLAEAVEIEKKWNNDKTIWQLIKPGITDEQINLIAKFDVLINHSAFGTANINGFDTLFNTLFAHEPTQTVIDLYIAKLDALGVSSIDQDGLRIDDVDAVRSALNGVIRTAVMSNLPVTLVNLSSLTSAYDKAAVLKVFDPVITKNDLDIYALQTTTLQDMGFDVNNDSLVTLIDVARLSNAGKNLEAGVDAKGNITVKVKDSASAATKESAQPIAQTLTKALRTMEQRIGKGFKFSASIVDKILTTFGEDINVIAIGSKVKINGVNAADEFMRVFAGCTTQVLKDYNKLARTQPVSRFIQQTAGADNNVAKKSVTDGVSDLVNSGMTPEGAVDFQKIQGVAEQDRKFIDELAGKDVVLKPHGEIEEKYHYIIADANGNFSINTAGLSGRIKTIADGINKHIDKYANKKDGNRPQVRNGVNQLEAILDLLANPRLLQQIPAGTGKGSCIFGIFADCFLDRVLFPGGGKLIYALSNELLWDAAKTDSTLRKMVGDDRIFILDKTALDRIKAGDSGLLNEIMKKDLIIVEATMLDYAALEFQQLIGVDGAAGAVVTQFVNMLKASGNKFVYDEVDVSFESPGVQMGMNNRGLWDMEKEFANLVDEAIGITVTGYTDGLGRLEKEKGLLKYKASKDDGTIYEEGGSEELTYEQFKSCGQRLFDAKFKLDTTGGQAIVNYIIAQLNADYGLGITADDITCSKEALYQNASGLKLQVLEHVRASLVNRAMVISRQIEGKNIGYIGDEERVGVMANDSINRNLQQSNPYYAAHTQLVFMRAYAGVEANLDNITLSGEAARSARIRTWGMFLEGGAGLSGFSGTVDYVADIAIVIYGMKMKYYGETSVYAKGGIRQIYDEEVVYVPDVNTLMADAFTRHVDKSAQFIVFENGMEHISETDKVTKPLIEKLLVRQTDPSQVSQDGVNTLFVKDQETLWMKYWLDENGTLQSKPLTFQTEVEGEEAIRTYITDVAKSGSTESVGIYLNYGATRGYDLEFTDVKIYAFTDYLTNMTGFRQMAARDRGLRIWDPTTKSFRLVYVKDASNARAVAQELRRGRITVGEIEADLINSDGTINLNSSYTFAATSYQVFHPMTVFCVNPTRAGPGQVVVGAADAAANLLDKFDTNNVIKAKNLFYEESAKALESAYVKWLEGLIAVASAEDYITLTRAKSAFQNQDSLNVDGELGTTQSGLEGLRGKINNIKAHLNSLRNLPITSQAIINKINDEINKVNTAKLTTASQRQDIIDNPIIEAQSLSDAIDRFNTYVTDDMLPASAPQPVPDAVHQANEQAREVELVQGNESLQREAQRIYLEALVKTPCTAADGELQIAAVELLANFSDPAYVVTQTEIDAILLPTGKKLPTEKKNQLVRALINTDFTVLGYILMNARPAFYDNTADLERVSNFASECEDLFKAQENSPAFYQVAQVVHNAFDNKVKGEQAMVDDDYNLVAGLNNTFATGIAHGEAFTNFKASVENAQSLADVQIDKMLPDGTVVKQNITPIPKEQVARYGTITSSIAQLEAIKKNPANKLMMQEYFTLTDGSQKKIGDIIDEAIDKAKTLLEAGRVGWFYEFAGGNENYMLSGAGKTQDSNEFIALGHTAFSNHTFALRALFHEAVTLVVGEGSYQRHQDIIKYIDAAMFKPAESTQFKQETGDFIDTESPTQITVSYVTTPTNTWMFEALNERIEYVVKKFRNLKQAMLSIDDTLGHEDIQEIPNVVVTFPDKLTGSSVFDCKLTVTYIDSQGVSHDKDLMLLLSSDARWTNLDGWWQEMDAKQKSLNRALIPRFGKAVPLPLSLAYNAYGIICEYRSEGLLSEFVFSNDNSLVQDAVKEAVMNTIRIWYEMGGRDTGIGRIPVDCATDNYTKDGLYLDIDGRPLVYDRQGVSLAELITRSPIAKARVKGGGLATCLMMPYEVIPVLGRLKREFLNSWSYYDTSLQERKYYYFEVQPSGTANEYELYIKDENGTVSTDYIVLFKIDDK